MKSLEDRDRVAKIQGLINECMTFLDDDLSALTGHYDDLLSMEDVIDQELILFVSLNVNKNTEPVRSLGKMLLQNIQLTVGKRYEDQADRRRQNRPIFSIVLDEFAPFGYRNFAQILQTARGTNTAFLFSMQSVPQLMQVGRGFKEEVTSAPNTTMTLRTRDEETAKYFIKASAEQIVTRRSVQKERGLFGWGRYEETGRATESEDRETRSQDESIKNLPKGRMEILMSDDTRGTLHSLVQVRPPDEVVIPGFKPVIISTFVALPGGIERRQSQIQGSGTGEKIQCPPSVGRRLSQMRTATVLVSMVFGALAYGQGERATPGKHQQSKAQHGTLQTAALRAAVRRKGGLLPFRDKGGESKRYGLGGLDRATPPGFLEAMAANPFFWYSALTTGLLICSWWHSACAIMDEKRKLWHAAEILTDVWNQEQYSQFVAQTATERYNRHMLDCNRVIEAQVSGRASPGNV